MATDFALQTPRSLDTGGPSRIALTGPKAGGVLLFATMFLSEANFRVGDMEQLAVDWQIVLRLFMCCLCGLYGLVHLPQTRHVLSRFPAAWLVLYVSWAGVCVVCSPNWGYATASSGALALMILFVPAVLQQLGGRTFVLVLLGSIFTYTVGSWFAYFYLPELGRTAFATQDEVFYRLGGLGHANDTGMQAAIGISLLTALGCQRAIHWKYLALLIPLLVVTLISTDSRTALVTTVAATGMCFWRIRPLATLAGGFVLMTALVALTVVYSGSSDNLMAKLSRSGDAEEITSATGRVNVWLYVLDKISKSPVVGYGHNCSRFVMAGFNAGMTEEMSLYHAHNTLLNITLGSGLPGGTLTMMMVLSLTLGFFFRPNLLPDLVLVLIVISGLTEVSIFHPIPDNCSALWLAAMCWRQGGFSLRDDSGCIATETA